MSNTPFMQASTSSPPPPPPPMVVSEQHSYAAVDSNQGSVGPVIGVLVAILILGVVAAMIGRLLSGRSIMGYGGHFDVDAWMDSKFSSCLDSHAHGPTSLRPLSPEPPTPAVENNARGAR
ncbi:hypothetical protein Droror1_Dr00016640 [Drosera rotundifolia]